MTFAVRSRGERRRNCERPLHRGVGEDVELPSPSGWYDGKTQVTLRAVASYARRNNNISSGLRQFTPRWYSSRIGTYAVGRLLLGNTASTEQTFARRVPQREPDVSRQFCFLEWFICRAWGCDDLFNRTFFNTNAESSGVSRDTADGGDQHQGRPELERAVRQPESELLRPQADHPFRAPAFLIVKTRAGALRKEWTGLLSSRVTARLTAADLALRFLYYR